MSRPRPFAANGKGQGQGQGQGQGADNEAIKRGRSSNVDGFQSKSGPTYKGKMIAKKAAGIERVMIKKKFYGELKKEKEFLQTPEYYRGLCEDDLANEEESGVVEAAIDSDSESESALRRIRTKAETLADIESERSVDDNSDVKSEKKTDKKTGKSSSESGTRRTKPKTQTRFDPFVAALSKRNAEMDVAAKERDLKQKEAETRREERANQAKKRETLRRKMTKRTARGQPIMSNQIDMLLRRIQSKQ